MQRPPDIQSSFRSSLQRALLHLFQLDSFSARTVHSNTSLVSKCCNEIEMMRDEKGGVACCMLRESVRECTREAERFSYSCFCSMATPYAEMKSLCASSLITCGRFARTAA